MEYISHEDYKKMLGSFGKEVPKARLNEGLEKEGNAFTAGLAKAKKGQSFKVGGKTVKDTSNYDSNLEEYQFDQMYPDDPGPFEGKDEMEETIKEFLAKESAVNWERVDDEEAESDETDNGIEEDINQAKYPVGTELSSFYASWKVVEVYNNFTELEQKDPKSAKTAMMVYLNSRNNKKSKEELMSQPWYGMKGTSMMSNSDMIDYKPQAALDNMTIESSDMEEGINSAPMQATGPTIQTVEEKSSKLAHLTMEEKDQLRQYVETIKTVKEQINKMIGKGGMKEGGDNTNLIMKLSNTSESEDMCEE
jgi:hypothetical protein